VRELALHILDLARNSLEAGASLIVLEIREDPHADTLEIVIRDNGAGMAPEDARRALDAAYTTRTTRRWGLGLPLFRATCERSGGELTLTSVPGEGTRVRALMRLSHLDRPPLGDLGAVVQALACESPHAALHLRNEVNGNAFELDTRELQSELQDVPLTHPGVLHWLRGHVNCGLKEVGSRA
jgi:anti-sigma regulatory factor (Ser/Thr protein kinase)